MFGKKPPTVPETASAPVESEKRRFTDTLGGSMTTLGSDITVVGDLKGKENVELSGKVEGSVHLDASLTVQKSGCVNGDVEALNVIIFGTIKGDVIAKQKIELRDACQVTGNLQAGSIAISEGAFFQGTVKMGGTSKGGEPMKFSEKRAEV